MTTLAELRALIPADTNIVFSVEEGRPPGRFIVSVSLNGTFTVFLFKGQMGSADAHLVGRVEYGGHMLVPFRGGELTGGERLSEAKEWDQAFAALIG